ncbi:hypothetical protein JTE90_002384 [Oedothorax gibbosus]|uniref:Uncharacterized protein n=1 Tax=Oedothorax gibbosus TaxID=931172 RepID=A0AAV6VE51_9ARAC|nr:hypothetical protein JTE90_002384 [Oedothorax gibbosus]
MEPTGFGSPENGISDEIITILDKYDCNQNYIQLPEEECAAFLPTEGDTILTVKAKKPNSGSSVEDNKIEETEVIFPESLDEEIINESAKNEGRTFSKLTKIKKKTVTKLYRRVDTNLDLVWQAYFTLNLVVIPVLLAILSGILLHDPFDSDPYSSDVALHLMLAFTVTALIVCLPFHLMTLDDIENAILQENVNRGLVSKTTTTTTYYYGKENVEEMC